MTGELRRPTFRTPPTPEKPDRKARELEGTEIDKRTDILGLRDSVFCLKALQAVRTVDLNQRKRPEMRNLRTSECIPPESLESGLTGRLEF